MSYRTSPVYPLDVNLSAGTPRILGPIVRSGNVVLDVPHGGAQTPEAASRLYVGTGGNVTLVKWDGTIQVYTGLQGGVVYDIASLQVNSAGTTASNLVWGS